jgi:hypothetical protein
MAMKVNAVGIARCNDVDQDGIQALVKLAKSRIHSANTEVMWEIKEGDILGRSRQARHPPNFIGLGNDGVYRNHLKVVKTDWNDPSRPTATIQVYSGSRFLHGDMIGMRFSRDGGASYTQINEGALFDQGARATLGVGHVFQLTSAALPRPEARRMTFCVVGLIVPPPDDLSILFDEWDIKMLPTVMEWFDKANALDENTDLRTERLNGIFSFLRNMPDELENL